MADDTRPDTPAASGAEPGADPRPDTGATTGTQTRPDVWQYRPSMAFAANSVDLTGFEVVGRDGSIGTVDRESNDVRVNYVVVDTGDWLPGRQVMLPAYTVERIDPAARRVVVDRTRDDIRRAPDLLPEQRRAARFEDTLTGYYHGL